MHSVEKQHFSKLVKLAVKSEILVGSGVFTSGICVAIILLPDDGGTFKKGSVKNLLGV